MKFKLTFHIKLVSFKKIDIWPIYLSNLVGIKFGAYQIWCVSNLVRIKFDAYAKYGHIVFGL